MVSVGSGSLVEGTTQTLSTRVRKTIQSIKEIVGNHSDADIYVALKETNMDPNETAQKLLNQDPFHLVKRKRDKKKEGMAYNGSMDQRKHNENVVGQDMISETAVGQSMKSGNFVGQGMKSENAAGHGMKSHSFSDRIARRGGYGRSSLRGISREFRVVRDNRVNQNTSREVKPASPQDTISATEQFVVDDFKMSIAGTSNSLKHFGGKNSSEVSDELNGPQPRHARDANSNVSDGKLLMEKQPVVRSSQVVKLSNMKRHSATLASTDPVHVPSPDSRTAAAVGAIKREVGVVGGRRQSYDAVKDASAPSSSFTKALSVRENSSETFRPFHAISKSGQLSQSSVVETVVPSISVSRSFSNNQYNGRPHQQVVGRQKVPQANKEWKPKSSQKSAATSPGVIGTPTKFTPADKSKGFELKMAELPDSFSQAHVFENQNVIIARHIRVPENDRCEVTFGSFGVDIDSSRNFESGFQTDGVTEESHRDSAVSLSASSQEASGDDASGIKQEELLDDQVRNSVSDSLSLNEAAETLLLDKNESSSPQNLDNYADIRMVRDNSPTYTPDSRLQQDTAEFPSFSAYDPQTGYDIPYFRPIVDDTMRGQGLPSPQEFLSSHITNSIPASTIAMVQQQQQQPSMAQMYPQVHVSHFTNLMPYRQFISPVFVPQMAVPGYSNNPGYPHPSNGSSYLLMPGGSTHLGANGLKYGIQQFKPVPGGSPTGFGNFPSPTGYAVNGPGVVGSATGLEDSSRIKYKESNLYVPNPQAETSEVWVPNPRELPGLQSAPYYNMPGQTPHATYLPSHTGHASYNAAAAQSSHMQFPGLYHPSPQPAAMANPHHLGPAMGGNVGVGVAPGAPGAQVGAYQQPQLGNLNWSSNF